MSINNDWYQWYNTFSGTITLNDAGGVDTLSAGNLTVSTTINLNWDSYSSIGAATNNVYIPWGVTIENANGGSAGDIINGNGVANSIYGFTGNDSLGGGGGNDTLVGGNGNDWAWGGTGHDYLFGEAGNDVLFGESGNDTLIAGSGVDTVNGGTGEDLIYGEAGSDTLNGNEDNDQIYGGDGDDTIGGDSGDDDLVGEAGNDWIWGGTGQDSINGGEGHDVLWGGSGADEFLYNSWSRWDTIKDFEQGVDILKFWDALSFNELSFQSWGTGVLIEYADTHIYVENSSIDQWTEADFDFVQASAGTNRALGQASEDGYANNSGSNGLLGGQTGYYITSVNGNEIPGTIGYDTITVYDDQGGRITVWEYGDAQFYSNYNFERLGVGQTEDVTFEFTYRDPSNVSYTATGTYTVTGLNDNPEASDIAIQTGEDAITNVDITNYASDIDGDALHLLNAFSGTTIDIPTDSEVDVAGWNGGIFTFNHSGVVTFDPGNDFQHLNAGEQSNTTVGFTVSDGQGGSDYQLIEVTINGANETFASQTSWINSITLADNDVNNNGIEDWREGIASHPSSAGLAPSEFFGEIATLMPEVNTVRFVVSPGMVSDGASFLQLQNMLTQAAQNGYQIHLVYGDGVNISNTNQQATDLSTSAFSSLQNTWQDLLDWVNSTPVVENKIWGYELINEPEVYRTLISGSDGYYHSAKDALNYVEDILALHNSVQGWGDKKIVIGGLGASSDFQSLNLGQFSLNDLRSPLEVLRDTFGADLIWSAHSYSGWHPENRTVEDWQQTWQEQFEIIASDQILLSEAHTRDGSVNQLVNPDGTESLDNSYGRALEWFGENGIGLSWWPVAFNQNNFSSQALFMTDNDDSVTPFSNNLYWANQAWQASPASNNGDGNQILNGDSGANALFGHDGDDSLYGNDGNDLLEGGDDIDVLFGGDGDDTLVGGKGNDSLSGNAGNDVFILRPGDGTDTITDFSSGEDLVQVIGASYSDLSFITQGNNTLIWLNGENIAIVENSTLGNAGAGSGDFLQTLFGDFVVVDGVAVHQNDILSGGLADDILAGLGGDDVLIGNAGDDLLNGGSGINTLTGGTGNDLFVFGQLDIGDTATTTVTDFELASDLIAVTISFTEFSDIQIIEQNGDTNIQVSGFSQTLVLDNVTGIGIEHFDFMV